MNEKELMISFDAELNKEDNEDQTYGCRHTNPSICNRNSMENICAFVREDHICHFPSRKWKKRFIELKSSEANP